MPTQRFVCTSTCSGRSPASLLSPGCSLMLWVQEITLCSGTKISPSISRAGTCLPSAPCSPCPATGRQTGNDSSCAWVNELITLHGHCQLCFAPSEVSTSQDLAEISGWLQGHFKKTQSGQNESLKYFSKVRILCPPHPTLYFFNRTCYIL